MLRQGIFVIYDGCLAKQKTITKGIKKMYKQYVKIMSFALLCGIGSSNVFAQLARSESTQSKEQVCYRDAVLKLSLKDAPNCINMANKDEVLDCVKKADNTFLGTVHECFGIESNFK